MESKYHYTIIRILLCILLILSLQNGMVTQNMLFLIFSNENCPLVNESVHVSQHVISKKQLKLPQKLISGSCSEYTGVLGGNLIADRQLDD